MFTDKIDPVNSNGVETIRRKYLIIKYIGAVIWSYNDDEGNFTQRNLMMCSTFRTHLLI